MRVFVSIILVLCFFSLQAQKAPKNSISTSLIRLEKNRLSMQSTLKMKYLAGIEYQRLMNKWSFGIKYEYGFNALEVSGESCSDCYYGTGYLREKNIYLTSYYAVFDLFASRLKLNTGLGIYYSKMNYSGDFQGGFTGDGRRINANISTWGIAPNISAVYYPTTRLFIAVQANVRTGRSQAKDIYSNNSWMNWTG